MIALVVVIIVAVFLWNNGFNVYVEGLFSAFFGTWADSPIAGIVLTLVFIAGYYILKFIKSFM